MAAPLSSRPSAARALWDASGSAFSSERSDAAELEVDAFEREQQRATAHGAAADASAPVPGPNSASSASATNEADVEAARQRALRLAQIQARQAEVQRLAAQKEKERATLGRRKARRAENARLAANPFAMAPGAADLRTAFASNPVQSTFSFSGAAAGSKAGADANGRNQAAARTQAQRDRERTLLAALLGGAGVDSTSVSAGAPSSASSAPASASAATESAAQGQFHLSLRAARRLLLLKAGLRERDLPPTREAWARLATHGAQAAAELGEIDEEDEDEQDEAHSEDGGEHRAIGPGAEAAERKPKRTARDRERGRGRDHGPLQRGLVRAAGALSAWVDDLHVPVHTHDPARSVVDLRLEGQEERAEPAEQDADTTLTPDAAPAPPGSHAGANGNAPASADGEPALWLEIERTPVYLCWLVDDAFDRLMVHCLARVYGCASFSRDEPWRRRTSGGTASADPGAHPPAAVHINGNAPAAPTSTADAEPGEGSSAPPQTLRCTYILNPRRLSGAAGAGLRAKLLAAHQRPRAGAAGKGKRRKRRGSASSATSATSAGSGASSLADSLLLPDGADAAYAAAGAGRRPLRGAPRPALGARAPSADSLTSVDTAEGWALYSDEDAEEYELDGYTSSELESLGGSVAEL